MGTDLNEGILGGLIATWARRRAQLIALVAVLIPLTVLALAEVKGVALQEMCEAISANGERLFGPWK